MSVSFYDLSIPVFRRGLKNLASFLDKAEAHATAQGADTATYVEARLIADMHPFSRQIQMASDGAKGAAARLAGVEPPVMADTETTFAELKARITRTVEFLDTISSTQVDARAGETIVLPLPNGALNFTAANFVLQFALPNFFFHVTTAYALLRAAGVPLGKMDFLAGGGMPDTV
jgi:uncharacterized protein